MGSPEGMAAFLLAEVAAGALAWLLVDLRRRQRARRVERALATTAESVHDGEDLAIRGRVVAAEEPFVSLATGRDAVWARTSIRQTQDGAPSRQLVEPGVSETRAVEFFVEDESGRKVRVAPDTDHDEVVVPVREGKWEGSDEACRRRVLKRLHARGRHLTARVESLAWAEHALLVRSTVRVVGRAMRATGAPVGDEYRSASSQLVLRGAPGAPLLIEYEGATEG
jgi:hypothetical protein